jgi:hypothetical protein
MTIRGCRQTQSNIANITRFEINARSISLSKPRTKIKGKGLHGRKTGQKSINGKKTGSM